MSTTGSGRRSGGVRAEPEKNFNLIDSHQLIKIFVKKIPVDIYFALYFGIGGYEFKNI